jgi:hypothetical protein
VLDYGRLGEGICEESVWHVENRLPGNNVGANNVEFDLFADECSSVDDSVETYDMWGGSKWHTIPDVLPMYGMCSYRDWYEYRQFMSPTQGIVDSPRPSLGCVDNNCGTGNFKSKERTWWTTSTDYTEAESESLSSTGRFEVRKILALFPPKSIHCFRLNPKN